MRNIYAGLLVIVLVACPCYFIVKGDQEMNINNPLPPDRMYTDNGTLVRCRMLSLGPWNMDADASKSIAHGLGAIGLQVITVSVWIIPDTSTTRIPLVYFSNNADPALLNGGVTGVDNINIYLSRRTGGMFDSVTYDDAVINRGFAFIWYYE